jgi:leukotriene-A4 hydrolase
MVPCQDTPSVKAPYTAEVTASSDLTVLMSAVRQGEPTDAGNGKKLHKFFQKIPIQSYLIAIAAGNIESRKIGPRSHVWSEKELVDKAAFDFSETETMLQKAEELCGPYVWGVYDILVLPPSFPYGGMENPCLTFATPTLLAGDRSLASVVAHEIAHSWSGNLVTNKNFEHFWLNEGFTVFTERKIIGRMSGESARHFGGIGGIKNLKDGIAVLGETNPLTALVVDLEDVDPDDAFSVVPYEKGSAFLWYLEDLVGGPAVFEPFLKKYYDHYKYQSIDSYEFKKFFLDNFASEPKVFEIDWDTWYKAPGMPKIMPNYDDSLAKACSELRKRWVDWSEDADCPFDKSDLKNFSVGQIIEFLAQLLEEEPLSVAKLSKMQELYDLSSSTNSEIKFRWIRLGLKGHWDDAVPRAVQMVTEQGRMKFLRPLYRDLFAWDKTKELAVSTFQKNRSSMMHVAAYCVENDLKLKP